MFGKVHDLNTGKLFACCDKELIGKKLVQEDLEINISKNFFGIQEIKTSELLNYIEECDQINIFGNKICSILKDNNLITDDQLIYIDGVAHIQIYKL